MRSFFLTIILIATAVTALILYYLVKHFLTSKSKNRKIVLIRRKLYEDDRILLQSRIRKLLVDLKSGQLHWLIISSNIEKEHKVELTYSSIKNEIEIKDRGRPRTKSEINILSEIGVGEYTTSDEINVISVPLNAKIITDVVYFIFEKIFNLHSAKNLKIRISGE
jgi:hypothetical protein